MPWQRRGQLERVKTIYSEVKMLVQVIREFLSFQSFQHTARR